MLNIGVSEKESEFNMRIAWDGCTTTNEGIISCWKEGSKDEDERVFD